ncbi:hypothetical protein OJE16_08470 [Pantoea tagorei]
MLESHMTKPERRKFRLPPGLPQIAALILVLLVDSLVANNFFRRPSAGRPPVRQPDRYS